MVSARHPFDRHLRLSRPSWIGSWRSRGAVSFVVALVVSGLQLGCGGDDDDEAGAAGTGGGTNDPEDIINPLDDPDQGPPAGNPDQPCTVDLPDDALPEDTTSPDHVIGDGTPESCTSAAVVEAVAAGGVITFDCGPDPIAITVEETLKIYNDTGPEIVIDGGGLVTLSGGGERRILYMNTCDEELHYTTSHCQDQDHPQLSIQNLTFTDGNARSVEEGGGAIFSRGGRIKIINSRFFNNVCDRTGITIGGAAVRVFSQSQGLPVYVVNSTFGGEEGYGNRCTNGGGISSIGVSWTVVNSLFTHNEAIDEDEPEDSSGGGKGGAIFNDGRTMTLTLCGTHIDHNTANVHGAAIFFVTNDHTGNIVIRDSVIRNNPGGSWYPQPGISMHDDTEIEIENSVLEE